MGEGAGAVAFGRGIIVQDDSELVDQILRIEELKEEIQECVGGQATFGAASENLPLKLEEQFLEHVLEFERAEMGTHRELLARDGVALPPPDGLTEEELTQALAGVIRALAERRIFLENTNHLSDRELYSLLCNDLLDDEVPLLPPESETNCHLDLIGSGSEDDICVWLTCYADEQDRAVWARDFPEEQIPPHRDPPYDRDRGLPRAAGLW